MSKEHGEIIIYDVEESAVEVRIDRDTVWLTQRQMAELFDTSSDNISLHLKNIFADDELAKRATTEDFSAVQKEGKRRVRRTLTHYNLDAIISVGYRVNSKRGVRFRQWATSVLRDHLIKGYTVNERRLAEKGLVEMEETIALLTKTLESHETLSDEGRAVLEVVGRYAKSWSLLLKYDEDRLELPKDSHLVRQSLDYDRTQQSIKTLKAGLLKRGEASDLFGQEREHYLQGILGNLDQTFGGQDLYASVEEKAAHLLYFLVKNHHFTDGNKRIAAFLFLWFLEKNNALYRKDGSKRIADNALVAMTLMIAESNPKHKDIIVKVIVNLINKNN